MQQINPRILHIGVIDIRYFAVFTNCQEKDRVYFRLKRLSYNTHRDIAKTKLYLKEAKIVFIHVKITNCFFVAKLRRVS